MHFKLRDVVSCCPPEGSAERGLMLGRIGRVVRKIQNAVGPGDTLYEVELLQGTVPAGAAQGANERRWIAYTDELQMVRRTPVRRGYRVDPGPRTL